MKKVFCLFAAIALTYHIDNVVAVTALVFLCLKKGGRRAGESGSSH